MDFDPISTEEADINLDNYYLDHQIHNTFVYVHKRFLPKSEHHLNTHQDAETYVDNIQKDAQEKCQQYDMEINRTPLSERKKVRTKLHDDSMIEQTVKFAKDLIPKVIPPSREFSPTPVYYTVKTSKKSGKKLEKLSSTCNAYGVDNKKGKVKNVTKQTKDREEVGIHSARDIVSHSSQNSTLDEVQTNHSSTFSLSEELENNQHKISQCQRKRKHDAKENFVISETFEAMGASAPAQAEIKISLMNDSEKNIFCESLRTPIINSVKEYLNEIKNSTDMSSHFQHLSQTLAFNSQKLDFLVRKLDRIEKYVIDYSDKTTKIIMSPKPILSKASKLEELAEDIDEIKDEGSIDGEDYHAANVCRNLATTQSAVVTTNASHDVDTEPKWRTENLGHGENVPTHQHATSTQFGIRADRPNRIPARFCWTDTTQNS